MTRVLRIDRISIVVDEAPGAVVGPGRAPAVRTPEGYLDVDAYLARDGLLRYSDGRATWMELRPRASLERAASSWAHAIVTDDHPPVMVDAANAREYQRGYVISAPRVVDVDGVAYLAARLRITDAELVAKILGGQRELSIGFMAEVRPEPGVTADGQRYDAVQYLDEESGNHVASVERGRAGPAVRVLLDSAQSSAESCYSLEVKPDHAVRPRSNVSNPTLDSARAPRVIKLPAGVKMDAIKAWCANALAKVKADEVGLPTTMAKLVGPDGTEIEVPTWVAALVAEALDERKAAEAPAPEAPPVPGDEAPALDPLAPPVDPKDKDKKMPETMTPDAINALVRRRGRLERLSATAGIASATIDAADDVALARAYVSHVLPHCKAIADKADGAQLDGLVEVAASTPATVVTNPFEIVAKADAAGDDDPIVAAYAAHLSR